MVDFVKHIKPSGCGAIEITTVNREFVKSGELKVHTLDRCFAWLDTGTHDSLTEATNYIQANEKFQGLTVVCLKGITLRIGMITTDKMRDQAKPSLIIQYVQSLVKMVEEFEKNGTDKTDVFPNLVKRPSYTMLDKAKVKETSEITAPYWSESQN